MSGKTAGIIIVGDEILKGHVRDSNSHFMSKRFRAVGTKVRKISVVEDDVEEIAKTVEEFSQAFDIVVTAGGIGPTHDDVTYKGIAAAFNEDLVCNDTMLAYWSSIESQECAREMSFLPSSAMILWRNIDSLTLRNKDGALVKSLPVVRVQNVFILPGVPQYLQVLFQSLEKEFFQSLGCSFYTGRIYLSVYEDLILDALNKTVEELKDCVFGSYPVVGTDKYRTEITVEAVSVARVIEAEEFFKALVSPQWLVPPSQNMSRHAVYKFLDTTADTRLAATVSRSIKVVEEAFDQYPAEELMVSFNGGKDCTALLHLLLAVRQERNVKEPLQAVYFRPAKPFSQVEAFIHDTVNKHQIKLTTLPGPIKSALVILLQQKPNLKAIFLGTRRTDPFSQNLSHCQMTDPGWTPIMRINPLLDWGYPDIWTFLRGLAVPYCCLYDQGYTSLGNQDNTRPNPCLRYSDADGTEHYRPAWMLTDDSVERNGRL